MLKHYIKIAWRNLIKDRAFTLLNILGLSVGLACTLLIGIWVADELRMDKYNTTDARLYQVMGNFKSENGIKTGAYTPGPLADALKQELPEVENAVTILPASWFTSKGAIKVGDKQIKAGGQYVSKDFFQVFTCPFVEGSRAQLFSNKMSVAISAPMAEAVFGPGVNAVGKPIRWDQEEMSGDFVVAGVFQPNPSNATDQFDLLFNFDLVRERRPGLLEWGNSDPSTYIVVKPGTDMAALGGKVKDFVVKKDPHSGEALLLAKFSDRYLYNNYENGVQSGGRIMYVRLFSIIALFILLIACINFMNLSTARASYRAREVGIKKVAGATRGTLILQYLCESTLVSLVSLLFAVGLAILLLPLFNQLTGKQLQLSMKPSFVLGMAGVALVTGLLAGTYPAFYLSAFQPVAVLKGRLRSSFGEMMARKGLVVFQFTLSVIFIAGVLIVYRQAAFIQSKDLGYRRDHVLHFEIPFSGDTTIWHRSNPLLNELSSLQGVSSVSSYYHNLMGDHGSISDFHWPGKNPNQTIDFANLEVGYNFLQTAGIRIREGSNFSPDDNARHEIVFNESAIKAMGLKDPVGKVVHFWDQDRKIVGVAADFNFESLYTEVKPCFFQEYPVLPNIMVRVRSGSELSVIDEIRKIYMKYNPGLAFEYRWMDEDYQALYVSEARINVLARYFAGLAIIISCLGLFGLAAFTAQKRRKEIGIRKVVGASVLSVAALLSGEFLALVLVAILIAYPLVWWGMHNWLNSFAYRADIGAGVFVLTAVIAGLITFLTIGGQALRAAMRNPVESLRSE